MTGLASVDGRIVPAAEARVSVFDRGFLYGDSVFEALRTYGGVPFALTEHLERLARSAERALIPLPVPIERFRAEVDEVVRAAQNSETYLRLMLTRGTGTALGLDPALGSAPVRLILALPLVEPKPEPYERGIGVITYRTQRVADQTPASGAKLSNYMVSVLAMSEARGAGADEALVVDAEGRVVEGTTSNVYVVRAGALVTPPEEDGILVGITRQKVLEIARALAVPVEQRSLAPSDFASADEAFISSSIREIVPVVRVDGAPVGAGVPGPVTVRLLRKFRELAREGRFSAEGS